MQIVEDTGRIAQIKSDRIRINGEWFDWPKQPERMDEFEEGDKVKYAARDGQIMGMRKEIEGDEDSGGEQLRSSTGGSPPSPSSLTKDQQISLKVAHKSAVRQLDRRNTETEEDYREMLTKLTKLHLQSLDDVEEWMQE